MAIDTQQEVFSVSELATGLDRHLRRFGEGWVEGEVQNWFVSGRGHAFFRLADEESLLECRIWASDVPPPNERPEDGQLVKAHFARPEVWPAKGKMQLSIDSVKATGEGELLRRQAEIFKRLEREGLTDPARHPKLPLFPRLVGLIAGPDARQDVITHLRDRFRPVDIVLCGAAVEGQRAVPTIIDALGRLSEEPRVDVIMLARGGGGVAELFPFSDERLCRAIFACGVPVVTSIGHTKQRPNCDAVAAASAHVPAKAAELVVPSAADLAAEIGQAGDRLEAVPRRIQELHEDIEARQASADPRPRVQRLREDIAALTQVNELLADGFYRERRRDIQTWLESTTRARRRLPELRERASGLVERVERSGPRIQRRQSDYGTAIHRHDRQSRQSLRQRLALERERVDRLDRRLLPIALRWIARERERTASLASQLTPLARRRLERSRERTRAQLAVIRAHDFRKRGWMLAADEDGQPVRSAASLASGQRIELRMHDGEARAVLEEIDLQRKEVRDE